MRRKKDKSNGITALYERLSRDDDNAGESNSIVHQKQMLEDYAMKHGFTNLVHFTDDGWSGATFDRPSWNRLVEGVKNGEITACICKDMSRIGRDHLQVGFFTDILFREKEVRFIAINNGIDSDRQETSEFAPFLNIMNEWFVRDTSKKIKAVLKSRGSSGNAHTSNIPPYGYLKDPENPDHWIIDEEAAEVVRRIYRMTIEGKGPYQIARELSEEKIERPSYYLGKKGLGNHASNYDKENPYMWRGNQVTTLIARPEYIGKTVNFRTFKNSYKDKKTKRADKEDWVVFDDTQEPIVDPMESKRQPAEYPEPYIVKLSVLHAAFYAKPDLRNVRPPEEPAKSEPATLNLESLVEQLQKSPELASALAALIAAQAPAK